MSTASSARTSPIGRTTGGATRKLRRPMNTLRRLSTLLGLVAFCLLPQSLAAETLGPAGGTGGTSAASGCGTLVVPAPFYRTAPFMLIGVAGRSGKWLDQIHGI